MDGVLWRGGHVIDGAPETLQFLKEQKKQIFFATNNATCTRAEVSVLHLVCNLRIEFFIFGSMWRNFEIWV